LRVTTHGPRAASATYGIGGVVGVEIDEAGLHFAHLRVFVQVEQFRVVVQHAP
jgi:hypothetical protein